MTIIAWGASAGLAAFFVYALWVLSADAPPYYWAVLAFLVALFVLVLVVQP
ncbi:hypothetical protein [Devosia riboflavina]|uniref:hypothetical protein n=1 Tax=Devosia riboflavina TaxID=46914 RepID=UPI000ACBB0BE|nr:hypothetical protein [Devosia riboflavina]